MAKRLIWGIEGGTAKKAKIRRQEVVAKGHVITDFEGGFYWERQDERTVYLNAYSTTEKSYQKALEIIDGYAVKYDLEARPIGLKKKLSPEEQALADAFRNFSPKKLFSEADMQEIRDWGGLGERRWF